MKVAVVIPATAGREENLLAVLDALAAQTRQPDQIIVVDDGAQLDLPDCGPRVLLAALPKHQPGMEQPRNIGVRLARQLDPDVTHAWFVDSDVLVGPDALEQLELASELAEPRILVAPYDWMPSGQRSPMPELQNDPRWQMFHQSPPERVYRGDLSAGLACFSGNLLWPVDEFQRVGGYWSEIHHGRCEDGELGLRAVAMDVPISFCAAARGWHMWHPVDSAFVEARNARDVPMLNDRHPWMQQGGVFMVDREGKAFAVRCSKCDRSILTGAWWDHAPACGVAMSLEVE